MDCLDILSPKDRNRLKLAGGEILDNIVKHAIPPSNRGMRGRVRPARRLGPVGFYFRSPASPSLPAATGPSPSREPFFDPAHRRWRGIGLVMCRNLSTRLVFRPGSRMDRIFLEFEAER